MAEDIDIYKTLGDDVFYGPEEQSDEYNNNDYLLDMNPMPTMPLYKVQHQEKKTVSQLHWVRKQGQPFQ